MSMLRNRQMKVDLVVSMFTIIIMLVVGIGLGCLKVTLLIGAILMLFIGYHFFVELRRYKTIAKLNENLDEMLHRRRHTIFEDCEEGELAILATNLNKLVRNLREQVDMEQLSKKQLADAMADISHQIKTPLTSINLLLSRLRKDGLEKEKEMEAIVEITKLTSKIEWLIYALLRIAKLDAGAITLKQEEISLALLLKETEEHLAIPMELRGVQFVYEKDDSIKATIDKSWTLEAVENIVKNCMEHTPEGGMVKAEVSENPIYSEIRITDTGVGIAKEDLPHIFERFYKGKNSDKNSVGIGLALAKQIVNAQNGTIIVQNRKNKQGAEFCIRFYKTVV